MPSWRSFPQVAGVSARPSTIRFKLASSFFWASQFALFISHPNKTNITLNMPFGRTVECWVTRVRLPRSANSYAASMSNCLPVISTVCAVGGSWRVTMPSKSIRRPRSSVTSRKVDPTPSGFSMITSLSTTMVLHSATWFTVRSKTSSTGRSISMLCVLFMAWDGVGGRGIKLPQPAGMLKRSSQWEARSRRFSLQRGPRDALAPPLPGLVGGVESAVEEGGGVHPGDHAVQFLVARAGPRSVPAAGTSSSVLPRAPK